jgi:carbonic anhydrase
MLTSLSRRRLFGVTAATFCPLCTAIQAAEPAHPEAAHAAGAPPHWSYDGDTAPPKWGELSAEFNTCSIGTEQTPIDLRSAIRAQTGVVKIGYRTMPLTIMNNGHTIQVNTAPGSKLEINGTEYQLLQFHFHHPSEHLLSGKAFDMELHFVHKAANGGLAVVGVFIQPGAANPGLVPIWAAMPSSETPARPVAGIMIDPGSLLPKTNDYFRYMGSLTTPPCSEGLVWTVFRAPIQASVEQIRQFATLFPRNARPVQAINRRFLLES